MTPKVLANMKEAIEDNVELLDGFDEIPEYLQGKVKTALADGHVGDDDWMGVGRSDLTLSITCLILYTGH